MIHSIVLHALAKVEQQNTRPINFALCERHNYLRGGWRMRHDRVVADVGDRTICQDQPTALDPSLIRSESTARGSSHSVGGLPEPDPLSGNSSAICPRST
jgi:hypothetical protein